MEREIITIGRRGQITLPLSVRKTLGLKQGDVLILERKGSEVVIKPAKVTPIRIYSDSEVEEFVKEDTLKKGEREKILKKWGL